MNKIILYTLSITCLFLVQSVNGKSTRKGYQYERIQMENIDRGLVAIHQGRGLVSVSWRKRIRDAKNCGFELYRKSVVPGQTTGPEIKLNDKPLKAATYFVDKTADTTLINTYILRESKGEKHQSTYTLTPEMAIKPYLQIPLKKIETGTLNAYLSSDASVGDLDGDGQYELLVKRSISNFSTTQTGISGGTLHLDAYKLDGTFLWQIDLGKNIREGESYFSYMVYDFNGDGKAEIICKTAEGTRFGDGQIIGDTNNDGITDYVNRDSSSSTFGKILSGPEFISVIEGTTGKELARSNFIERGNSADWGDAFGINVDQQLTAVAYLDGKHPSFIMSRGSNGRIVMEAWNYRNNKLEKVWNFDTKANNFKYIAWSNQGNASIRIGDVDLDGKDEIIFGSCAIDHDGTGLYSTGWGYGESLHLADIDPDKNGLEVWQGHDFAPNPYGSTLHDAATGKEILHFVSKERVDFALTADIDPNFYGMEVWSTGSNGLYSCTGKRISTNKPAANMAIWWDGDLSRELLDKFYIDKWTGNGTIRLFDGKGKGLTWCNGSKGKPCLLADIFGDWREEVIWPSEDGSKLRIYSTPIPTSIRLDCLMQDPIYRMNVAIQNAGNNQTPHTGFYLGTGKTKFSKFLSNYQ